jgi:protein-disulfide isomerase
MKKLFLTLTILFITLSYANANVQIKTILEGNINAKIKLIIYESLTCSHCANFHKEIYPELKKDFIDKGLISIEFRNFPLDLAAFNASKVAHCKNDGKSEILHFLFEKQKEWVRGETIEDLNKNLKKLINEKDFGIDFDKCINDTVVEDHVLNDRINAVKKYDIQATPTLIINDKKFDNPQNYKKLKKTLEKLI